MWTQKEESPLYIVIDDTTINHHLSKMKRERKRGKI